MSEVPAAKYHAQPRQSLLSYSALVLAVLAGLLMWLPRSGPVFGFTLGTAGSFISVASLVEIKRSDGRLIGKYVASLALAVALMAVLLNVHDLIVAIAGLHWQDWLRPVISPRSTQ